MKLRSLFVASLMVASMGGCYSASFYTDSGFDPSTLELSTSTFLGNGIDGCRVTVVVRDAAGPVRDANVTVQAEDCTVTQPVAATDGNGVATAWLVSTTPGIHKVTALLSGSGFTQVLKANASVTVVANLQQTTAMAGDALDLQIIVRDANGTANPFYTGTMQWRSSDAQATLPAAQVFAAADDGYRFLQGQAILRTAGQQTVVGFDRNTGATLFTQPVFVEPAAADHWLLVGVPDAAAAGQTIAATVTAVDYFDNVATQFAGLIHFSSSDPNAQLPSDHILGTDDAGTYAFHATLVGAGAQTLSVNAPTDPAMAAASAAIAVRPGTPAALAATLPPTTLVRSPVTLHIGAVDAFGNICTTYSGTLQLNASDANTVLPASLPLPLSAGGQISTTVSFQALGAQSIHVVDSATAFAAEATTLVQAAGFDHFALSGLPSSIAAGTSATLHIEAVDAYGDTATTYAGVVQTTSSDPNFQATPSPVFFLPSDMGAVDVVVTLATAGVQTIRVADIVSHASNTATLTVTAQPVLAELQLTGMPPALTAGTPRYVTVRAVDAYGNTLSDYLGTVHFTCSDPNAVVPADTTFAPTDNGNKTFTSPLTLVTAGSQTLSVADVQNTQIAAPTQTIQVGAAPSSTLVYAAAPVGGDACVALPAITVASQDAYGNPTALLTPVTLSLVTAPAGFLLQGTQQQMPQNNIATFSNIVFASPNPNCILRASTPGLASTVSAPIAITATAPTIQFTSVSNANGLVTVDATVQSACPANVTLGYQLSNSGTYVPAHILPGSSKRFGVTAPTGTPLTLLWDAGRDAPNQTPSSVDLQLTATVGALSAVATNSALSLNNSLVYAAPTGTTLSSSPDCLIMADINLDGITDAVACVANSNQIAVLLTQANGALGAPVYYAAGAAPAGVASGDLNRDGWPDLVVADANAATLSVLLGTGSGALGAATAAPFSSAVADVALADINLDGILDAVVVTSGNTLEWALGSGTGSLVTPGGSTPIGTGVHALQLSDLNHDGAIDAVVTNSNDQTVGLLSGTRTGFAAQQAYSISDTGTRLALTDLRRVGAPDVVVASATQVYMLLNEQNGTLFNFPLTLAAASGIEDIALVDADVNGTVDLVIAGSATNVAMGDGTGRFAAPLQVSSLSPSRISMADVNRDGLPDILGLQGNEVTLLTDSTVRPTLRQPYGAVENPSQSVTSMGVGDFNEDGLPDLLTVSGNANAVLLAGNGDGTFNVLTTIPMGANVATQVAVADFNGDGHADAATAASNLDVVVVLLGDGQGHFTRLVTPYIGAAPTCVAAGDLNRDGKVDLVATASLSDTVVPLLGDGTGHFSSVGSFATDAYPGTVLLVDLNRDSVLDAVVVNGASNDLSLLLGNGSGGFGVANNSPQVCAYWLATGDFNNDGAPDFISYCSSTSQLSTALGDGAGGMSSFATLFARNAAGLPILVDFDGDGNLDIGLPDAQQTTASLVVFGDGQGNFPRNVPYAGRATTSQAADFNADGLVDFVAAGSSNGVITWLNVGAGAMEGVIWASPFNGGAGGFTVVDIDRNGLLDAVATTSPDYAEANVQIAAGQGTLQFSPSHQYNAYATDPNAGMLAVGDINNDGALDVVSADLNGNDIIVWLGNGTGLTLNAALPIAGPNAVALADLNRDGLLDVVVGTSTVVAVALNQNASMFGSFTTLLNHSAATLAIGDVDNNGTLDVVASSGSTIYVKLLNGAGNPVGGTTASSTYAGTSTVNGLVLADMNRDGIADWLAGNNGVWLALGLGNGTFSPRAVVPLSNGAFNAVISDIDGDGKPDAVVGLNGGGGFAWLRGDGAGGLAAPRYYAMSTLSALLVAAGDVNNDGYPEVVGMDATDSGTSVMGSQ